MSQHFLRMKIFFLFLCAANLQFSSADRNYDVDFNSISMDAAAEEALPFSNMTLVKKDNSDFYILDGTVGLARDVPDNAVVMILGFQEKTGGNGYETQASLNFTAAVCEFITSDNFIYLGFLTCSNYPTECPIKAGSYTMIKCELGEGFPDEIPGPENWRFDIFLNEDTTEGKLISKSEAFIRFDQTSAKVRKMQGGGGMG